MEPATEERVKAKADLKLPIETNALTWLAVHGNLCLALRHWGNTGASRQLVVSFVKGLGRHLVHEGLLTEEELEKAEKLERQFKRWR